MRSLQARSYSDLSVEPLVLPDKLAGVGGIKLRPEVVCPPMGMASEEELIAHLEKLQAHDEAVSKNL